MNRFVMTTVSCLGMLASSAIADVVADFFPEDTGGELIRVEEVNGKWEVEFERSDIAGDVNSGSMARSRTRSDSSRSTAAPLCRRTQRSL